MKVLLSSLPHLGHVVPMAVLKKALESAGHEVRWEIPEYDTKFSGPLAEHLARFQNLAAHSRAKFLEILSRESFDLLVTDPTIFAVEEVGNKAGIPWALFSNLPLFYPFSRTPLVIQGSVPEFEEISRPNLHYVGPILPFSLINIEYPENFSQIARSAKPVLYVTQGTVATQGASLIKTCQEIASNRYLVVDKYIQHTYFMPLVDVFITNGGYGGVQAALWHGIPMIIAGETEDKPIIAAKAQSCGVAVDLKTANPSKKQLKEAVNYVLNSRNMRTRSKELARECKKYSLSTGIRALEQLAGYSTRRFANG